MRGFNRDTTIRGDVMLTIRCRRFGVLAICLITLFLAPAVFAQTRYDFNLPSQALADSLRAIGQQTSVNILFDPKSVEKLTAPAVHGQFSASQAVSRVLAGTNLAAEQTEANTLLVEPKDKPTQISSVDPPSSTREGTDSSRDFRMAQVGQGQVSSDLSVASRAASPDQRADITEIVVTAEKKSERLQDVPVPVTVVSPQALIDTNQLRLQDYFTRIPGLNVTPDEQFGTPILSIRGITTGGYTNPTVGIVIDDVPYGSSTSTGSGYSAPDIDPFDLAQVEVLRGPQGTLYGADSMGGLIKYTTLDPSTEAVSGQVQAGTSSVYNGANLGYNFRAAVNMPLSDQLAVRLSAFTRTDPGYIDNPRYGIDGVNKIEVDGAHLLALWRPSDSVSLKISALFQDTKRFGSNDAYIEPGLGDLQQNGLPGYGRFNSTLQEYSATLKVKLGEAELTSLTGYGDNRTRNSIDETTPSVTFLDSLNQSVFGVSGTAALSNAKTDKFSEEVRLSAPIGDKFDWLVGAFYTHERSPGLTDTVAADTGDGAVVGTGFVASLISTFEEYAAFTDLTYRFTNQFDVQVGARESQNRQSFNETDTGPYVPDFDGPASPLVYPYQKSTGTSFTYLVTPRFKFTPDIMAYARIASGYRPGGPNPGAELFGLPNQFGADKTQNYEIGLKADLLDRKLTLDASVYYIDWKEIQILLLSPTTGEGFYANGNQAKSQGLELSFESHPAHALTIAGWIAWNQAVLTAPFPATSLTFGTSGDRLPYAARLSGNFSVDENVRLTSRVTAFIGGSESYVGEREGEFEYQSPSRQSLPSYAQTDLRAGGRYDAWTINFSANNVFDKRGLLRGGQGSIFPFAFNYTQPRTIGLSLSRSF
jgi:iron complex outermembrane recepter protein